MEFSDFELKSIALYIISYIFDFMYRLKANIAFKVPLIISPMYSEWRVYRITPSIVVALILLLLNSIKLYTEKEKSSSVITRPFNVIVIVSAIIQFIINISLETAEV